MEKKLFNGETTYFSGKCSTLEEKKRFYNALSGGEAIKNYKNRTMPVKDVAIIMVSLKNNDGTESECPRSSFILDDDTIVSATSWGVYNCLERLNMLFGSLHFDEPLRIVPVDVATKSGSTINLVLE